MHVTLRGLLGLPVVECLRCGDDHIIKGGPKPRIYDRVWQIGGCGIPPQKFFVKTAIGLGNFFLSTNSDVVDITPFQLEPAPPCR